MRVNNQNFTQVFWLLTRVLYCDLPDLIDMKKIMRVVAIVMISASAFTFSGCSNVTITPIVQEINKPRTPIEEAKIETLDSDLIHANVAIMTALVQAPTSKDVSGIPLPSPTFSTSKTSAIGAWNNYVITITDSELDITLTRDSATGKTSSSE